MPLRACGDSSQEVYEYVESDEESDAQSPSSQSSLQEDVNDAWDAEPATLRREGALFAFKIGNSVMSAWGTPCSSSHPNVHRLELPHSWLSNALWRISERLPRSVQALLQACWPTWFLPPVVVLKRQKPQWEEAFECEKNLLATLRPVQGLFTAVCYGEVQSCIGSNWHDDDTRKRRSLLLSYLDGCNLNDDDCPAVDLPQLEAMLQNAFRATTRLGVAHGDVKLENMRLVGDRVVLTDFELSYKPDKKDVDLIVKSEVAFLIQAYQDHCRALAYNKQSNPTSE